MDDEQAEPGDDQRWVAAVVADHGKAILGYATRLTRDRHVAEDVVQEALVRAWRHHTELSDQRGSVRGWLLTVIRNIVIDRARAQAVRPREVPEEPTAPLAVADHADQLVDAVVLLEAMERLSVDHRSVLTELYFRDRSVTETAQTLGVPAGTVKSRSYHALRQLRVHLQPADAV
jgi:RNA polymerase sigma-70 factor, ECF subfamily